MAVMQEPHSLPKVATFHSITPVRRARRDLHGRSLAPAERRKRHGLQRPLPCSDEPHIRRLEESLELPDSRRVAHFAKRLCLDLADTLAGHFKLPANFFERPAVAVHESETLLQNLAFTLGQARQDVLDL